MLGCLQLFNSTLFGFDVCTRTRTCVYTPKGKLEVSQASGPGNSTWPVPGEPLDGCRGWLGPAHSCQCWPPSKNSEMLVLTKSWHKIPYHYPTEEERKERVKSFSSNSFYSATHWRHSHTQPYCTFWSFYLPSYSIPSGLLPKCLSE